MTAPTHSSPNSAQDLEKLAVAIEKAVPIAGPLNHLEGLARAAADALRSLARSAPAPAPHGGDRADERLVIAKIINGPARSYEYDFDLKEQRETTWRVVSNQKRNNSLAKADAILALTGWREPTDADVERVAVAIEKTMFAPHEFPLSEELHGRYLVTARAAITSYHGISGGDDHA